MAIRWSIDEFRTSVTVVGTGSNARSTFKTFLALRGCVLICRILSAPAKLYEPFLELILEYSKLNVLDSSTISLTVFEM